MAQNAIFTTFSPHVQKVGGSWYPVPTPSKFFLWTLEPATKKFRAVLTSFEFTLERSGTFLRKMAVRNFFSKFNVNLLELGKRDFFEAFCDCRRETPCTDRLRQVALRDPLFVLWGPKVANFGKFQSRITPNRK